MIYLIWTLVSIFLVLYFFYVLIGFVFNGKNFLNNKPKKISIFLLIIGSLQMVSTINSGEKSNIIVFSNKYNRDNNTTIKTIVHEKNLVFHINTSIKYSVGKNELIPIESNSHLTGLISGYTWKFNSLETNVKIKKKNI